VIPRDVETFAVPDALAGERIDRAVALLTGWSRAEVQALVATGAVLVDGQAPIKSHRLTAGAVIELLAEPESEAPLVAEPIPIDVRYADDDIVVVPSNISVKGESGRAGRRAHLPRQQSRPVPVLE